MAVSTYSHASWYVMLRLLDAHGGVDLIEHTAADVLTPAELSPGSHPAMPAATASSSSSSSSSSSPSATTTAPVSAACAAGAPHLSGEEAGALLSFYDLAQRCSERGLGVLIGWQRCPRTVQPQVASRAEWTAWQTIIQKVKGTAHRGRDSEDMVGGRDADTPKAAAAASLSARQRSMSARQRSTQRSTSTAASASGEPEINPTGKEVRLDWMATDVLIVMQSMPTYM